MPGNCGCQCPDAFNIRSMNNFAVFSTTLASRKGPRFEPDVLGALEDAGFQLRRTDTQQSVTVQQASPVAAR